MHKQRVFLIENCERFLEDICIINGKYVLFLVFSILQKFFTRSPILKFEFPLKICTKNVKLNMKNLSHITPNLNRLGVHRSYFLPRFQPAELLSVFFFLFDGFLASHSVSKSGLVYMTRYHIFCYQKVNLPRLKSRDFGNIISLKQNQIGDPKASFSNFLKYGEIKENHVFTIDNTNAPKKSS